MVLLSFAFIVITILSPVLAHSPFLLGNVTSASPTILTASPPGLFCACSPPLLPAWAGMEWVVSSTFTNNDPIHDWAAYFIVEVRDTDAHGVSVILDWQSGTMEADSRVQVGVAWTPEHAGNYELRTFAVTDLENPRILSPLSIQEVTIATAQSTLPLLVGNRSYDISYSFSSAEGLVQSAKTDPARLAIILDVDILRDTSIKLGFQTNVLGQLERESEFHYCVGDDFAVFVNGLPADFDYGAADDWESLTIPLNQGANRIEIVGTDLLESPRSCLTGGAFAFVTTLPVEVNTWDDAVTIARDYLDNHSGEEKGVNRGGPLGSVELVYLHDNGTAFIMNRYDGSLEDVYPYFNYTPRDSYFWIVTLNYEQDHGYFNYRFTIDAQAREVKDLIAT